MACIETLLSRLGPTIEAQIKPNLKGIRGLVVRGYLPQVWVFDTGAEIASLVVDNSGNVRASSGTIQPTDILITATHDLLSSALEAANGLRSRDSVIRGPIDPQFFTTKGQTAFNFLRGKLGL